MANNQKHTAGALDIRNVIGSLLAIYGVILVLMGLFGDEEGAKTGDWNANLYAGIVVLAGGVIFLLWALWRPTVVPEDVEHDPDEGRPPGH